MRKILVFSGPIAVGKSTVIAKACESAQGIRVSTRQLIQSLMPNVPSSRAALQVAGDTLDLETKGTWIADAVAKMLDKQNDNVFLFVDSVRIPAQVQELRKRFGSAVHHVHLTAAPEILQTNFEKRKLGQNESNVKEYGGYEDVRRNSAESNIELLSTIADRTIVVDTLQLESIVSLSLAGLGLQAKVEPTRLVDVVVGGQYGSEGKGNVCDFLGRDYSVLMRVGGPNAGHKVAEPEYDYIHMPSGTAGNPETRLLIGAGATLDLNRVLKEISELGLTPKRLSIDPQAIIIEQSDRDFEAKDGDGIGSTKKGVGIATARKIIGRFVKEPLGAPVQLARDVRDLHEFVRPISYELEKAYLAGERILLEGTQGTGLSLHHGDYPFVTSRETTASGCLADAGIPPHRVDRVFMVTRTYPIRVGGESGDMGREINFETIAERSGMPLDEIRKTEVGTVSKKQRRIGEFCWERVRRAAIINGATDIALTFADYLDVANRKAKSYEQLTENTKKMIADIENLTGVRVSLVSVGFGRQAMIDRR